MPNTTKIDYEKVTPFKILVLVDPFPSSLKMIYVPSVLSFIQSASGIALTDLEYLVNKYLASDMPVWTCRRQELLFVS